VGEKQQQRRWGEERGPRRRHRRCWLRIGSDGCARARTTAVTEGEEARSRWKRSCSLLAAFYSGAARKKEQAVVLALVFVLADWLGYNCLGDETSQRNAQRRAQGFLVTRGVFSPQCRHLFSQAKTLFS
jgi:hypothetical protein